MKKKAVFHWSGGKDSALSLLKILNEKKLDVIALVTIFDSESEKSNVHSIPIDILEKQANTIGIPLHKVFVNKDLSNYKSQMQVLAQNFRNQGVSHFIFGDLDISGMKSYRENLFQPMEIHVVEPLENMNSEEVMRAFLKSGIKAKIVVIQEDKLDKSFLTKELNHDAINLFPPEIDICGEFGEYHTLSYAGGLFKNEVEFSFGEKFKISEQIKLENGAIKTFNYWQVEIKT